MTDKKKNLTIVLFTVYLAILVWILLFKMTFSVNELDQIRSINLIPFSKLANVNGRIDIKEIIENMLIFIPVGVYACMLRQKGAIIKKILAVLFISLLIEILQYILAIGVSDITDIIGNTLGGVIGIGIFYLFTKIFKNKAIRILNVLASIVTIGLVGLLAMLLLTN